MGGCQNYGPFWDPYFNTALNIQGSQQGTIILTTTHIEIDSPRMENQVAKGLGLRVPKA